MSTVETKSSILGGKHFLILGPESGETWWLKRCNISRKKKHHCQWAFLRGDKRKWIFHSLGNILRPLKSIPALRERVLPTEWQVRTVLGDCISRAKVIPAQALQYRQCALISDFLDLASLTIQEEAAFATNWIKHRPEGLKLQNLTLATRTGRFTRSFPKNLTADVHYSINKCESLGSGKQLILHGNPSAIARDFPSHMAVFRRHFCRMCTSNAVCYCRTPSVTILTSLQPAVNPLPGCSSGKPRSRPIGARVCLVGQFDFFSTAFDLREWTMVVFRNEDSGHQLRLVTPENKGEHETSSPSPARFTFFDDPDVPLDPPNTPPAPATRIGTSSSTCCWER